MGRSAPDQFRTWCIPFDAGRDVGWRQVNERRSRSATKWILGSQDHPMAADDRGELLDSGELLLCLGKLYLVLLCHVVLAPWIDSSR